MPDEKRYEESVVFDNQFHRRLSGVRNNAPQQNHPDVNRLIAEHHQQSRRTLYSMPSAAQEQPAPDVSLPGATQRNPDQRDQVERTLQFDEGAPSLYNFRHSMRMLQREVKRAKLHSRPLTLCVVGFHDLPLVYSKYGVLAQEQSIKFIGETLSHHVDLDIDVAGRYETYRFLLVFPECGPPRAAERLEEIRVDFDKSPIKYHQYNFKLVGSFGLVSLPHHGDDWKTLIAKADVATDMIIEQGGNALGSV